MFDNPALARLMWLLDGLDTRAGWGTDAADVLAPELASADQIDAFVARTRQRSTRYAPVRLVSLDVTGYTARAGVRRLHGGLDIVHCTVGPEPPHRITRASVEDLVPDGLTPSLPMDFTRFALPHSCNRPRLIVFSGVPASGKSTIADAVGQALAIPVYAIDWLLGALTPHGGRHLYRPLALGNELLTTLAVRQLSMGQSAILDSPAEEPDTRRRWKSLADRAGAGFTVVLCVCSDATTHRLRAERRVRGVPGWHDRADWADITRRLRDFPPWPAGDVVAVDTSLPRTHCLTTVLEHLGAAAGTRADRGEPIRDPTAHARPLERHRQADP